jgi:hypothetical protein
MWPSQREASLLGAAWKLAGGNDFSGLALITYLLGCDWTFQSSTLLKLQMAD